MSSHHRKHRVTEDGNTAYYTIIIKRYITDYYTDKINISTIYVYLGNLLDITVINNYNVQMP